MLNDNKPDLVLLDLMLPGLSGEEVLKKIQGIPVIVISAKIDIDSKVDLLMAGAADYLTKPFDTKELLARIAVQLRKKNICIESDILTCKELKLDLNSHMVTYGNECIKLTKTEYAILKVLMINVNQVLAKSVILDKICEESQDCTEDSLKQHISNLRVKLKAVSNKDMIEAIWGIGYKISDK